MFNVNVYTFALIFIFLCAFFEKGVASKLSIAVLNSLPLAYDTKLLVDGFLSRRMCSKLSMT